MDVHRLNRLARQLRGIALRASQGGGELPISVGELAIVEDVARCPNSTITDIVRRTGLAQSRVSKVVREFADEGVFLSTKDPNDGRMTRVQLHPKVRRQTFDDYGSRPIDDALNQAAPQLSAESIARAKQLLDELAELLDANGQDQQEPPRGDRQLNGQN